MDLKVISNRCSLDCAVSVKTRDFENRENQTQPSNIILRTLLTFLIYGNRRGRISEKNSYWCELNRNKRVPSHHLKTKNSISNVAYFVKNLIKSVKSKIEKDIFRDRKSTRDSRSMAVFNCSGQISASKTTPRLLRTERKN